MSTSNTYPVRGERAAHIIAGAFGYSGTAIQSIVGDGFVVVRDAVGKYTVTFDKSFPDAISAVAGYQTATTAGKNYHVEVYSKVTGSIQLRLEVASTGALVDPETGVDAKINFVVVTRDSVS